MQLFHNLRVCANLSDTRLKVSERHIVKVEEMQQSVLYMELNRARPFNYTLKSYYTSYHSNDYTQVVLLRMI